MQRPALLLAILMYVTLDLSSPAIPGAFVFDAADSVESAQLRGRTADEIAALPGPFCDPFVLSSLLLELNDRLIPAASAQLGGRPVLRWRSRALLDPAPPSENPH